MPDVFDVLRADHRETTALLDRLLAAPHDHPDQRLRLNELKQELVIAESKHEAIEEMHFWPAVAEAGTEGEALRQRGLAQEQEAKFTLQRLEDSTPGDGDFDVSLHTFSDAARAHIRYEEEQVWRFLEERLDEEQRQQLGSQLEASRALAPTRPHPAGPQGPAGLKTAGTVTGLMDRALDALTGRGHRFDGDDRPGAD